ncbi:unnamed protein product [Staurois parvus]|uniref:Uncharacterized protein n=1 Tax=Staurois parvus TaxID=386267 RepID=A0ABN9GJ53_9NEOB|nr:unnamed protein product [Staurois parvus]
MSCIHLDRMEKGWNQGRTDHLETRSVGGPMRCPWYLFHRHF